jgi:integrin beta 3
MDLEVWMDDLADVVRELVERRTAPLLVKIAELERTVSSLPTPRDGAPGRDGAAGRDGAPGRDGSDGQDGSDGRDGKDGVDGFGFDDLTLGYDGERTLTLRFARAGRVKEFPVVVPWPLDLGVWKAGNVHARGDGVTHGGSWWIAQRDTTAKPGESEDWRMCVKRGRDGKDGLKGDKGDSGAPGRAGRDLTNLAPDGSKWA